jgi:hypothetical protein
MRRLVRAAATAALVLLSAGAASGESSRAAAMHGVLRGTTVTPEGYFEWKPDVEARWGKLGTFVGTTREFERIEVEFGGDRRVWSAAQRAAYEAQKIRFEDERGNDVKLDVKGETATARVRAGLGAETMYAIATKGVGRTVVFARTSTDKPKDAPALLRVLQSILAHVVPPEDDVDAWLPAEVKTPWTRTATPDLLVIEDGGYPASSKDAALKAVRDAHAFVKRSLGVGFVTPFPPVVRLLGGNDLAVHLARKGEVVDPEANYLPWAGELLIAPHGTHPGPDAIARAAARQAVHHCLGSSVAEPVWSGLALLAEAAAIGAPPGALLPRDEGMAYERIKTKQAKSWARLLKTSSFHEGASEDSGARGVEAEIAVGYLVGSTEPMAKASLGAWVQAMRKWGHPDAGAEGAFAPMDPAKSDAEFWRYWAERADPPKKPKPGDPTPPAKPTKPSKPAK